MLYERASKQDPNEATANKLAEAIEDIDNSEESLATALELIKNPAININFRPKGTMPLIYLAINRNRPEIITALLLSRPELDLELTDKIGRKVIQVATGLGLKALLDGAKKANKKIDIDWAGSMVGETALHAAARLGRYEDVLALLQYGANKSIKNRQGKTPIEDAQAELESAKKKNDTKKTEQYQRIVNVLQ